MSVLLLTLILLLTAGESDAAKRSICENGCECQLTCCMDQAKDIPGKKGNRQNANEVTLQECHTSIQKSQPAAFPDKLQIPQFRDDQKETEKKAVQFTKYQLREARNIDQLESLFTSEMKIEFRSRMNKQFADTDHLLDHIFSDN